MNEPCDTSESPPDAWSVPGIIALFTRQPRIRRLALPWLITLDALFHPTLLGQPMSRAEIGRAGEILGARWLRGHRRKILYRNYRGSRRGEVDIVARHGETLTFVEVKTRTSNAFGRPADAVTRDKQQLIQRGALDWLRLLGKPQIPFRFDILEVLLIPGEMPRIQILENAFTLADSALSGR